MQFIDNIPVWGTPDPGAVSQIKTCALTADKVALMADHHKGYAVPIGGVVAYKDAISPSGVGYDIACGNKAVRVDMPAAELCAASQSWARASGNRRSSESKKRMKSPCARVKPWLRAVERPLFAW